MIRVLLPTHTIPPRATSVAGAARVHEEAGQGQETSVPAGRAAQGASRAVGRPSPASVLPLLSVGHAQLPG